MNQIGCVLTFKPGTDPNEIIRRLKALEDIADTTPVYGEARKHYVMTRDGRNVIAQLSKFNPEYGSPVFYIP